MQYHVSGGTDADEIRYQIDLLTAMNHKLSGQEKMYRLVCESSFSAFLYYSFDDDSVKMLGNWKHYFDFEIAEPYEMALIFDVVDQRDVFLLKNTLLLEKRKLKHERVECRGTGRIKWYVFETNVIYDEYDNPVDKIITISDISTYKQQTQELIHMAYYDVLTGLYNRNYFVRYLGEYVRKAQEEKAVVSVIFIDIDDFRKINDGMGMVCGDGLLQAFGEYLGGFAEENVVVSHFNRDLFCIAVYEPFGPRSVEHICKTVRERVKQGFSLPDGENIRITVSIGISEYPEAASAPLDLINCAEIVMFKAKSAGKNRVRYFDVPILQEFLHAVEIENQLKDAVFHNNFSMCYQPQYYVKTGKLRGVEALIRWREKTGASVSPSVFIPIAEKNGTIVPIGNWVIEESAKAFSQWKTNYCFPMILSINISAIQYKQTDFVETLLNTLNKYQIDPHEIELEITESILIEDFKEILDKLEQLRDYGIKVSLDDFGTGYSSLSYLKGLPIDTLKIDKSFMDTVLTDNPTKIITESIVSMVKKLGYETIAEGVEMKEQYDYLKEIGCDMIQGYYMSKPVTAKELELLLEKIQKN